MKVSELMSRRVENADGTPLGIVHDLRVRVPADAAEHDPQPPDVVALVVGPDDRRCRLAYAWGYAQGRARGPAVLRALLAGQAKRTRAIPVGDVDSWDLGGRIRLRGVDR